MLESLYCMMVLLCIIIFILVIIFTQEEILRVDKAGREYDASIFIVVPLVVLNLTLCVILAFESWNIETLYVSGTSLLTNREEYPALVYFFFAYGFINVAFAVWKIFEFFIDSSYEQKGKWEQ